MRRLRQQGWSKPLQYDRDDFSLIVDDGRFFLGNVFKDWSTYPARERAKQLDRAIAFIFEGNENETFAEVEGRLLPVVRNFRDLQAVALEGDAPSLELWQPHQLLADPLGIVLAIDRPTSMA